ncbi:hypothetical protein [Serratia sp. Se-RSBMAAmG]|uniref:hypothetical protein n=1 Tax=Serratia sp. Se-RSBMAAmG TaxID=3043305 RepID=UPI0024AF5E1F|nr:hypothetical protein [Serratia sp. Se-RSBMAAmG]MDI6977191.1 hypothetical protein [Serratia sp. Se-RSBMAAmG]
MLDFLLSINVIYCMLVLLNIVAAWLCFKQAKIAKDKKSARHPKLLCGVHGLTAFMFAFTLFGSMTGIKLDFGGAIANIWPQEKVLEMEDCPYYRDIGTDSKVKMIAFDSKEKTCVIYSEDGSKLSVKLKS